MSIWDYDCPMVRAAKRAPRRDGSALAFEGGTGYLLSRIGSLARSNWARMLAERDLTPHHYGVLMALDEVGEIGQQRLSALIGIDPRNAVPIIDGLAGRGLLAREIDPDDRRRRVLALTHAGRAMVRDLAEAGARLEGRFLRALEPREQSALHRMLLTLLASVADESP